MSIIVATLLFFVGMLSEWWVMAVAAVAIFLATVPNFLIWRNRPRVTEGGPTGTVVMRKFGRDDTAEGSGTITATGPVLVPEDEKPRRRRGWPLGFGVEEIGVGTAPSSQSGQKAKTVDVTDALSHHAGTECRIIWRDSNRDAERLAELIKKMLTDANWQVRSFDASDESPKPDRPPAITIGWWDVGQEQAFHTLIGVIAVMDYEIKINRAHNKGVPATIHVWSMQRRRPLEAKSIPDS